MAHKLSIKNLVTVPVEFRVDDDGKPAHHKFTIQCERIGEEEFKAAITDMSKGQPGVGEITNEKIKEKLLEITKDWTGQKFVLDDETDQPSAFSTEAFAFMLDQFGILDIVAKSFRKVSEARAKNS